MEPDCKVKRAAEIDGVAWQAVFPFCAGCPELTAGDGGWFCAYGGNGCRFPDSRKKSPVSFVHAFYAIAQQRDIDLVELCRELGDCR